MTPETVRMSRHHMFYSPKKAVEELGFPQTPAKEALRRAVDWFENSMSAAQIRGSPRKRNR